MPTLEDALKGVCVCVGGGGGLKGLQNLQALNDSPSMFTIH